MNVTSKFHEYSYVLSLAHVLIMNGQIGLLIFELNKLHAVLVARFLEHLEAGPFCDSYLLVYLQNISHKKVRIVKEFLELVLHKLKTVHTSEIFCKTRQLGRGRASVGRAA